MIKIEETLKQINAVLNKIKRSRRYKENTRKNVKSKKK